MAYGSNANAQVAKPVDPIVMMPTPGSVDSLLEPQVVGITLKSVLDGAILSNAEDINICNGEAGTK